MRAIVIVMSCFILAVFPFGAHAEESSKKEQPEFTKESILKHFRYHYSPKEAFDTVQKAALWLSEKGEAGLEAFSKPNSEWNNLDGYHLQLQVHKCDEGMVFRHPNPKLKRIVGVPNLASKFKDHSGKLIGLVHCKKMLENPKGAWEVTYTTFNKSSTGVEDVVEQFQFGVGVPGYPWQVVSHLPYQVDSPEELEKVAEELNALVDEWSFIEHPER